MTVYAVTLCFNRPDIIALSVERFHATKHGGLPITHIMVDQHYPLPDKQANHAALKEIAERYGCLLLDPGRNLGLHHGLNWALQTVGMKDNDIVIGYDGDSYPIEHGWDMALVTALMQDEKTVWASLYGVNTPGELGKRGYTKRMAGHIEAHETHTPAVNSICAWKGSWIRFTKYFREPHAYYGGIECSHWNDVRAKGYRWVFLPGWTEDERLKFEPGEDRLYKQWKWQHVMKGDPLDFESWLRREGHIK